jgi:hypothetical protein
MAGLALGLEEALFDDALGADAGVVEAGGEEGLESAHAVPDGCSSGRGRRMGEMADGGVDMAYW